MRNNSIGAGGVRMSASPMGAYVTNSRSSSSTITTPVMSVSGAGTGGTRSSVTDSVSSPLASPSRKRSIESISTPSCLSYCSTNTTVSSSSGANQQSPYHVRPNPALASSAKGGSFNGNTNLYNYEDDGRSDDDSTEEISLRHMLAFSFSGESPDDQWLLPTPRTQNLTVGNGAAFNNVGQQVQYQPHQPHQTQHFGHASVHSRHHHQDRDNFHHLQQLQQHQHQHQQHRHQHQQHQQHQHQHQHQHHLHHSQQQRHVHHLPQQYQQEHLRETPSPQSMRARGTSNSSSSTPNLRYRAYQPDIVSSIFRR